MKQWFLQGACTLNSNPAFGRNCPGKAEMRQLFHIHALWRWHFSVTVYRLLYKALCRCTAGCSFQWWPVEGGSFFLFPPVQHGTMATMKNINNSLYSAALLWFMHKTQLNPVKSFTALNERACGCTTAARTDTSAMFAVFLPEPCLSSLRWWFMNGL